MVLYNCNTAPYCTQTPSLWLRLKVLNGGTGDSEKNGCNFFIFFSSCFVGVIRWVQTTRNLCGHGVTELGVQIPVQ